MNNVQTSKRVDWVDIAKGIGMLLVIFGHCEIGQFRDIVFSFHMPLFFICSGFTIRFSQTSDEFKKNTKRTFLYLMGNAFGIFLMHTVLKIIFIRENRATPAALLNYLSERALAFIGGSGAEITFGSLTITYVGVVWFLMALLWGRIVFDFLHLICRKKAVFYLSIALVSIAGYALGHVQWLPMSLDIAFVIQPLFLFGYVLRKADLKKHPLFVCVGSLTGWIGTLLFIGVAGETVFEFAVRSYPFYPLCFVCAILGSMFIIGLSVVLSEYFRVPSVPLKLVGKYSILMFWVHGLDFCIPAVNSLFYITGNGYINALIRIFVDCFIFAIVMLLIRLFRKNNGSKSVKTS